MADFPDNNDENMTGMGLPAETSQMSEFGSDETFGSIDTSLMGLGDQTVESTSHEMPLDDTFDSVVWDTGQSTSENLKLIRDIPANLVVEFGRTKIAIRHLLQLVQGSMIELDSLAGEPMDILVNGCLIAKGEIVVVDEKFGLRLTEIISPTERYRQLGR